MTAPRAGHRPRAARRRAVHHVRPAAARGPRRRPRASRCTRGPAPWCSRPSAPTSAATSSPGCSPRAWTGTRGSGCSSTSAPTARSCSATATGCSPPRRRPARRSRARRSGAGCAPPTARSRCVKMTPRRAWTLQVIGDAEPAGLCGSGPGRRRGRAGPGRPAGRLGRFVPEDEAAADRAGPGRPADQARRGAGVRAALARRARRRRRDSIYLSQRDVRELQFAKAAIATGWSCCSRRPG